MAGKLQCPGCRKRLTVPDKLLGRRAGCPACGRRFRVPAAGQGTAIRQGGAGNEQGGQQRQAVWLPPTPPLRPAQPARFVAAPAPSGLRLGDPGSLPELVLEEGPKRERPLQNRPQARSALLLGGLAASVAASLVLLLVDGQPRGGQAEGQAVARQQLEMYYRRPPPLEPYQQLLREALQAHHRGDAAAERQRYRRVLDLLRAEDNSPVTGLTGLADAQHPPHDRHLEQLLSTLLSKDPW